jgi:hypothetical protein
LAVERAGKKRDFPRQFIAENAFRGNGPAVEPFEGFDGLGAQSRRIAEYLVDGGSSSKSLMAYLSQEVSFSQKANAAQKKMAIKGS